MDKHLMQGTQMDDLVKSSVNHTNTLTYCVEHFEDIPTSVAYPYEEIVSFLTQEAGVGIRITDDCGRTPLHDALWNRDCQYGIVDGLVRKDPSLLLLCDKRGHTPFEYARREHWDVWKQFLWDRREHMMRALDMDVMKMFRIEN
jgi:hypothetical protein